MERGEKIRKKDSWIQRRRGDRMMQALAGTGVCVGVCVGGVFKILCLTTVASFLD